MRTVLALPEEVRRDLWKHLLPDVTRNEEAAFLYARSEVSGDTTVFQSIEWMPVPPDGFASRSGVHLELTDGVRASVIKRAHDLGASLVELHSHTGPHGAVFSPSDLLGFQEFVPHVWWRLKGRPYIAVVIARSSLDAFAWVSDPQHPQRLDAIVSGHATLTPSGLSPLSWASDDE